MATLTGNLVWQEMVQDEDGQRDQSRRSRGSPSSSSAHPSSRPATRKQKAVAACSGAIVTSLLMTPFDVIKTRIQTQSSAEPLFRPSSHITPPIRASSEASTSRNKLPPPAKAHSATCCQPTFFIGNSNEDKLTCRFDPNAKKSDNIHNEASLKKPNPRSMPTSSSTSASHFALPQRARPIPLVASSAYAPSEAILHPSSAILTAPQGLNPASACAFPDKGAAALQLDAATRQNRLTGMWDGVLKVSRAEGVRGLWRGLSPTLVMTVPSQVTYMTCYDVFRSYFLSLERSSLRSPSHSQLSSSNITPQTLSASLISGALARSVSATLVTPLELVRTRLQASDASHSLNSIIRDLSRQVCSHGPSVLFRGLASTLWRDVPFSAIYFMGYETTKRMLTGGSGLGEVGSGNGGLQEFGVAFVSGATSGSVAAVITHPFDLVKTRFQAASSIKAKVSSQHSGMAETGQAGAAKLGNPNATLPALRMILREEGIPGLFRGLTPRMAKVAPACGLMIGSYEAVGHLFAMAEQD